ncbi:hypothetical protein [Roseibium aggregatum]|uniref:Uncharacterized protein n=1 Tax=Roseibium aggregatum TaxID=187304 RepID=A0A0M6Y8Z5_9HYPH|nr:hypothetical protein [Roseibium aggregatum]CTQ45747.1 hypothetical protein LAL4801_04202 [Roseibium aggregatum]
MNEVARAAYLIEAVDYIAELTAAIGRLPLDSVPEDLRNLREEAGAFVEVLEENGVNDLNEVMAEDEPCGCCSDDEVETSLEEFLSECAGSVEGEGVILVFYPE